LDIFVFLNYLSRKLRRELR